MFAVFLQTIFVNDNAIITKFYGEEEQGRRIARYDYRVPHAHQRLHHCTSPRGTLQVGMKGSFWVDPDTLDVLAAGSLCGRHSGRQPASGIRRAAIDYTRTRIGDRDVMLPETAELRVRAEPGEENREPPRRSRIAGPTAPKAAFASNPPVHRKPLPPRPSNLAAAAAITLPAGLTIPVRLTAPVTGADAVGTLIEGRVAADVKDTEQTRGARRSVGPRTHTPPRALHR